MRSLALIIGVGNTLQHLEFKGPPTYEDWLMCWIVFEAAMLRVDAVSPPSLEAHRLKVLFYHTHAIRGQAPAVPLSIGTPVAKREVAVDVDAGERQY